MKQFLTIGRLVKRKGLLFLTRTWAEVVKKHPDYHLVIVGSGDLQPDSVETDLVALIDKTENVSLIPETDNVIRYYQEADAFILASEKEGLSNVLLEAMSMSLPIIATEIGGNVELIQDKKTGLLFKVNNKESFINAVDLIYKYPNLGKNARKKVIEKYSIEKVARQYGELYERA
jgi:glycosyltransferase involved in cell wall biosynthesis